MKAIVSFNLFSGFSSLRSLPFQEKYLGRKLPKEGPALETSIFILPIQERTYTILTQ